MNSHAVTRLTIPTGVLAALFAGLLVFDASCAGSKPVEPAGADGGSGGAPALDTSIDQPAPAEDVAAVDGPGTQPDAEDDQGGPMSTDPRKTLGISCNVDSECRSGSCVDGVCCSSACAGACLSCAVKGSVGQCIPAEIGTDPREQCPDQGLGSCGTDGVCDGSGACRKYPAGVTCQAGSCSGSTMTLASRCDGTGTCVPTPAQSCAPFTCEPMGPCRTTCKIDTDCAAPNTCMNGSCGKKPLGTACSSAAQCNSGFCEQGTCCGSVCDGTCRSCALTGTAGTCSTVQAGEDPLGQCADSGAETCGTDGTCNGAGACRRYRFGTVCLDGTCKMGTESSTRRCDGAGSCQSGTTRSCEAFNCGPNGTCLTACATSDDCAADFFCSGGICAKKTAGETCASGAECGTGLCQQGVCCTTQCTGGCRSCNLSGSPGICKSVPAGMDPLNQCPDAGAQSCGTTGVCDGNGACRLYANTVVCGPGSCAGGRQISPSRCNGTGGCLPGNGRDCAPYVCAATNSACLDTCSTNTECSAGNVCVSPSCGKKPMGAACAAGGECASTICAQGFCCATACSGTCMSCGVPGSEGTCSAVTDGAPEPQNRCADAGKASCGTDGTCNGKGACRVYNASTVCAAATCVNAMFTPARSCTGTGAGACTAATATVCPGAFQCDATGAACRTTCTIDDHCVGPNVCIGGLCRKKNLADPCDADNECASGLCQQKVCCSSSCTGACRSCALSGSAGTCSDVPLHGSSAGACPNDGQMSCKRNGLCDGAGNCEQYAAGLSCAPASCSGDTIVGASTCNGTGSCQSSGSTQCRPFTCNANGTCKTTCSVNSDCVAPSTCMGGTCGGGKPNGTTCAAGTECLSTFCAPQGVCCDDACNGTCESCNQAGSVGTCKSVPAGQAPSPTTQCADQGAASCGTDGKCNGSGACKKYATGTSCMNSVCDTTGTAPVVGRFTPARTCNATSMCATAAAVLCGNFGCSTACKTSCLTDADCVGTSRCFAGQCGGLKGVYFKNATFTGAPANTRVDANVDVAFGNGSPFPADVTWPVDSFTVRWSGWLTPRFTGTYVLQTLSDDGIAVFLNGTVVTGLNNRAEVGGDLLHNSGNITLTKDQPVSIRVEYFENGAWSQAHVRWANVNETGALTTFQPIPTARLTPDP